MAAGKGAAVAGGVLVGVRLQAAWRGRGGARGWRRARLNDNRWCIGLVGTGGQGDRDTEKERQEADQPEESIGAPLAIV